MKLVVLSALAALAVGAPYFTRGDAPLDIKSRDISVSACAGCHKAEHEAWAKSRHGVAFTNGIFQSEFQRRPRDWCVHCHAPLKEQLAEFHAGGGALTNEGVGCASCHVRNGVIHARTKSGNAPHATLARDDFGDAQFCGGCHQFNFPKFDVNEVFVAQTEHPMQATVAQFEAGPFAQVRCGTCHGDPHEAPGAHSDAMLQRALQLTTCRDNGHIVTKLSNFGAGHNVPTGDVHRHVTLRVWRSSAPDKLYDVYIGRRFKPDPAGGNFTSEDWTLAPGQTRTDRVKLADLGGGADEPVNVELRYVYVVDEFPAPRNAPKEPTFTIISLDRTLAKDFPACL